MQPLAVETSRAGSTKLGDIGRGHVEKETRVRRAQREARATPRRAPLRYRAKIVSGHSQCIADRRSAAPGNRRRRRDRIPGGDRRSRSREWDRMPNLAGFGAVERCAQCPQARLGRQAETAPRSPRSGVDRHRWRGRRCGEIGSLPGLRMRADVCVGRAAPVAAGVSGAVASESTREPGIIRHSALQLRFLVCAGAIAAGERASGHGCSARCRSSAILTRWESVRASIFLITADR